MDISLLVVNASQKPQTHTQLCESFELSQSSTTTYRAQWAGANNPLWIIRTVIASEAQRNEAIYANTHSDCFADARNDAPLIEVKADKMPIAIYERMDDFTNHEIELQKGDCIYLMSDGYEDQFGGPKGKKFLSRNLKQLLLDNSGKSLIEQREILENSLNNWIGKGEQIDDITILGMKI
jgi:hypothetical protein